MVPVRETSKPCAPFLSRIRFTWYRNTTAESRGAVSFRRGTFLSSLRTTSRTGPSSNERVHELFLSFSPFFPSMTSRTRSRFSRISCSCRRTHTISCVRDRDRYDFSLSFDRFLWIFFSFLWNFSRLIF